MSIYTYAILAAGTVMSAVPFPLARTKCDRAGIVDRRARVGVLLQDIGCTLQWQGPFWRRLLA